MMDNSAFGDDANRLRVTLPGEESPDSADPGAGSGASPVTGRFGRRHLLYGGAALGVLLLAGVGIIVLAPGHPVGPLDKAHQAGAGEPMIAPAADLAKIVVAASPSPPARPAMVVPAKADQLRQVLGFHEPADPGTAKPADAAPEVKPEAPDPVVAEVGMTVPAPEETSEQTMAPPAAPAVPAESVPASEPQPIEVAQLAAMIRDEQGEIAALRADQQKAAALVTDKLGEVERHLALAEAKGAIGTAKGSPPAPAAHSPTSAAPQPVRRYRVQAASPNLVLLAPLDRDDGAPLQIGIGDDVPGYGKVTRIAQHGTAWVVETEHGKIQ